MFNKQSKNFAFRVVDNMIAFTVNCDGVGYGMNEENLKELMELAAETYKQLQIEKKKEALRGVQMTIPFKGNER